LQNTNHALQIKRLQKDVNELKGEIKNLRTVAAFINRTPLPDCITKRET
jgi:hypothetical protein